jgi:hypothetical protein
MQHAMSKHDDFRNSPGEILNQDCRELWSAVVFQAREDIRLQPQDSLEYDQAIAFFTGVGEWAEMRTMIGDFLEMHRDDLEFAGRRVINQRRALDGLPPLPPRQPKTVRYRAPKAVPGGKIAKPAGQPITPPPAAPPTPRSSPGGMGPHVFNPFMRQGAHSISP